MNQEHNQGVSVARNTGINMCTGEYIGFCDADDSCEPEMFESMLTLMVNNDADMACCAIMRRHERDSMVSTLWLPTSQLVMEPEAAMKSWLAGRFIGNSVYTKLTSKNLWSGIRFPEGEVFEEAQVIPQLICKARKVVHTGTVLYNYYYGHASITSKPANERLLAIYKREDFIRQYVSDHFPGLDQEMNSFEVRNNMSAMYAAEIAKRVMNPGVYAQIKQQFNRVFLKGLLNRYISVKDKIKMIELKTNLFYLRKWLQGEIL